MRSNPILLIAALGVVSTAILDAQTTIVLESFESGITNAALGDQGGSRINDNGVAISQYTKTGTDDINVTDGSKSLQIDLSVDKYWVTDWKVTLSDAASKKVRDAMKSPDVARYVLRYDIIFPGGVSWMNNEIGMTVGSLDAGGAEQDTGMADQLESPSGSNGGKRTMSIALDLLNTITNQGPIILRFSDNFDTTADPWGPLSVYLDNIRLVDTYASGAKPVTYTLQSFEDANDPTGGATDWSGGRTTYSQYKSSGPNDIRVSNGTHALQVDYTGAGTWKQDFKIPFQNTKLADVLKLDLPVEQRPAPADLARYTLRFDVTYPDRDAAGLPNWENTGYDTGAGGFPFSQVRTGGNTGHRQTVSLTLDQVAWGDSGGQGFPTLGFIANSNWADTGSTLYYDYFRLIDTGVAGTTTAPTLGAVRAGSGLTVTFTGTLQAADTVTGPFTDVAGATSPYTATASGAAKFYRARN